MNNLRQDAEGAQQQAAGQRIIHHREDKYIRRNIPYGQSSAKLPVTWSLGHLVTQSLCHLVTRSLSYLVTWSLSHSVTRSLGHLVVILSSESLFQHFYEQTN